MNWRKEMIGQLTIILLSSVQAVRISRAVRKQSVEEQHPGICKLKKNGSSIFVFRVFGIICSTL